MSRILVVDDEPLIVETMCAILKGKGYSTIGVNSGLEAIAKARDFQPDLLLIDVLMPGLSGFEAGLRVKELCPGCRLLFFSGYSATPEMTVLSEKLRRSGYSFELLTKPLPSGKLLDKVKAALLWES